MQMLINPLEPWVRVIHFTSSQSPGAFLLSWECSKGVVQCPLRQSRCRSTSWLSVELAMKWLVHDLFLGSWKNVFEVYLESLVLETQLFSWASGWLWSKRMHHSFIYLFIHLFILACAWALSRDFSSWGAKELLLLWSLGSRGCGLSSCSSQA